MTYSWGNGCGPVSLQIYPQCNWHNRHILEIHRNRQTEESHIFKQNENFHQYLKIKENYKILILHLVPQGRLSRTHWQFSFETNRACWETKSSSSCETNESWADPKTQQNKAIAMWVFKIHTINEHVVIERNIDIDLRVEERHRIWQMLLFLRTWRFLQTVSVSLSCG